VYLALEGVAGAIGQVHVLRFRQPHAESELRAALRELVRLCPRLRSVIERRFFGACLAVLPDGARVDELFQQAFRSLPIGTDEAAVNASLNDLVNEPFALEQGLPWRVCFLSGKGPPILIVSLHHVVCDGRGMITLLENLLRGLNGQGHLPMPVEDSSLLPAIWPLPVPSRSAVPGRLLSLWRSYRLERRSHARWKNQRALTLVKKKARFGPTGIVLHTAPASLDAIKAAAEARDCTVTELLVAALGTSFAGPASGDPAAVASVRLSVDLRPYFPVGRRPTLGNYVASVVVHLTNNGDREVAVASARAQLREARRRFEAREMSYPLLRAELAPRLLGRRLYGACARWFKRRGFLQDVTLHISNLGSVDRLNRHGDRAQAGALAFFTPALGPYVGCVGLGGCLYLGVSYPRSEVDEAAIKQALIDFDRQLAALCATIERKSIESILGRAAGRQR
jgi:hypothetical protein